MSVWTERERSDRLIGVAVLLLILFALIGFHALAASSAMQVKRQAVSSGGTVNAKSSTRQVSGTLGQVATGRAGSSAVDLGAGFWYTTPACDCRHHGDLNASGYIDVFDVVLLIDATFRNGPWPTQDPFCPYNRGDFNCDGTLTVNDVVWAVGVAFRNGSIPCDPCAPE